MKSPVATLPEDGYEFANAALNAANLYLLPVVREELDKLRVATTLPLRVFELGCGNGAVANALSEDGYSLIGCDPSTEGIRQATRAYPHLMLAQRSAYDDLRMEFGQFPVVLSLEVVEHLYFPRKYAATVFNLLDLGGTAIISTPYHGYWKNLALAVTGRMDEHFTALWDYGHIKFWSVKTLSQLLREAGFVDIRFRFVGRIPIVAKSMIAIARKPTS